MSAADNLVVPSNNMRMPALAPPTLNVFLRDRSNAVTTLVSANRDGTAGGNGDSIPAGISANGRFALIESRASDLVAGDTNGAFDVFVRDVVAGTNILVSVGLDGSRCPADNYLSAVQRVAGFASRVRSYSMNGYFGPSNPTWAAEKNEFYPTYLQFLKRSRIPNPAGLFVFLEEHPDSINDGYFINNPDTNSLTRWIDLPGSFHDGALGLSFADGHTEIHMWKSSVTIRPVSSGFAALP